MMRASKKRTLLAGAAALAFSSASALAADVPVKAPKAAAPLHDWTGWYGGYNVGVGVSQMRAVTDNPDVSGSINRSGAGFAGGVQGGFNWQFDPRWVAGAEADIGYLGTDRSFADTDPLFTLGVKTNWYGTIRARYGYSAGPSLFYATGGVAFVDVKNEINVGANVASESEAATGWTLGGGIETLLGGRWSVKAEYLFIDAGSQKVLGPVVFGGPLPTQFENRFHVFRYGLNYKFGGQGMPVTEIALHDWAGFYAGLYAGSGLSNTYADTDHPTLTGAIDIAHSGSAVGLTAGKNWHLNQNWIAGLEGDFGYAGIDRSLTGWFDPGVDFGVKANWHGTIRSRLGYSTGPAMLYVTGGVAFVQVKNNFDTSVLPVSKSDIAQGWVAGAGVEAVLAGHWSAKTEYLYIDAGSQSIFNPAYGDGHTAHFDNRFHVLRFGLNHRFGS